MEGKFRIGFSYTDVFGNEYSSESYEGSLSDESEIEAIGRQFNTFLAQCGYYRSGTEMLMSSLTEDEVETLEDYLREYRNSKVAK
jgi:hypothetical protein